MATFEEILEAAKTALLTYTGGPVRYRIGEREVQHATLRELMDYVNWLQSQVAADDGDDPINYVQFTNGSGGASSFE